MRLPSRRGEKNKITNPDYNLTPAAITKLTKELADLEKNQVARASAEVQRTGAFGDFSENAEYQYAKASLRRILDRITTIKHQLNRAIPIATDNSGRVTLGSTVDLVTTDKKNITYTIVGAMETKPADGFISHQSPLGTALLHKKVGDTVSFKNRTGQITNYEIIKIYSR